MNWQTEHERRIKNVVPQNLVHNPFLYMNRLSMTKWLTRIDLYRRNRNCHGSVVECGVRNAASLMIYYHLSSILHPFNFEERIIGFDTFEGFPSTSDKDPINAAKGGEASELSFEEIKDWIEFQDENRPGVGHIPKVEFVVGDACVTIPKYINDNPHLLISLLVLDFDLYAPTKVALEAFVPLMPKGGIIVFDELGQKRWSGETEAMKEVFEVNKIKIEKFSYDTHTSFFEIC